MFLLILQENIATVLNEENDKATDEMDNKLGELQNELLRLANSKDDYNNVADEIYRLRELKQNTLSRNAERQGKRQRIAEMPYLDPLQEQRLLRFSQPALLEFDIFNYFQQTFVQVRLYVFLLWIASI